jgi:hypothetical protein
MSATNIHQARKANQMNISMSEVVLNDITLRNNLITTMLGESEKMIHNFSRKYRMDYEECYQHASLLMLEVYPNIPDDYNVKAYLNATVRRGLYALLKRHIDYSNATVSFEKPIDENDNRTYLDILQAPEQSYIEDDEKVPAFSSASEMTEAVYSALRECRIDEQEYAVTAFKLTDYVPVAPAKPRLNYCLKDKPRRTDNMLRSIKRVFGKHPQVQALVQRETYVL